MTSKRFDVGNMSINYDHHHFSDLYLIWSFPLAGFHMILIATFNLKNVQNLRKTSLTHLTYYCFEKRYCFCLKMVT